ncbi:MAG: glutathione S-transferase family protein [Maricaulis sp.]|uniref:glutathione S-transferase family protein n=1 Tax=Maricaulis sp. TaxID=1486257 RepID=UPI001B1F490E|nr:glutathione S-transferase family protein [Maricaulis sp.]MBO6730018.1 glutathione S-transferase family protein [Maricaulis sp.]MBO6847257.1 glutathione S-transferase family protein [Maricaulis sp.]MBO6876544.1 glutathione S-transferase family protein [Maricaulis sp.]
MRDVKLYGYATSPFVRKTACFLYFKGIDFTHVPVNPVDPAATIGHTGGTSVPVLEIDGEVRRESSHHAHWLDEVFAEKPIYPEAHREVIDTIDAWVSNTFLLNIFRPALEPEMTLERRFRFWRLAALVSAHTPLPEEVRHHWPDFVGRAPFIQAMAQHMDLTESVKRAQMRVGLELAQQIGGGPYMGGLDQPSMLDLAVFPQLVFGYMFGLEPTLSAAAHPVIKDWLVRMADHLPENPTLVADNMQVNTLRSGLG